MNLFEGCMGKNLTSKLQWLEEPSEWNFAQGSLEITPTGETDFFRPSDRPAKDNACLLFTTLEGNFTAQVYATTELVAFGDAAAITIYSSPVLWAKLCIERSPVGEVSIVSVVTNPWSDDANNELLQKPESYLRITRKGQVLGMHYSLDGMHWRFVRTMTCAMPAQVKVGVQVQAPFKAGCRATFEAFQWCPEPVANFRSGE